MKCVDIPEWLKGLPLAPEFRPTDTEFADPIAYISKIEKEASAFGICKVIPPLPKPSRKYVAHNLNKSLSKCPELGDVVNVGPEFRAVFTTRNQELGKTENNKQKQQVWQSGQVYTLEQFEAKSKNFARTQLGMLKEVSPEIVEAMFWKSSCEEPPIYFEYANDVPGSAFGEPEGLFHRRKRMRHNKNVEVATPCNAGQVEGTAGWKLANSPWNLQVIARSPGSLTRFMPHDIPGVTSPMIYIGMLFSWFAWHVEDHELHSLNFLHMGSPKTWYAVPGDYAFSFEEVIRCHAYGVKTDRLAALTLLGEKTTLLSPDAVVASGIPCCRLVQNPGEFVVTFPRAYHVGFSHGFNCGEAANFGTPQWLTVAKEAAVRRAAMNYLPMLSHQQLLYLLTVSFVSSVPRSFLPGCRSSRLRDRQKEERELLVKKAFVEDIEKENNLVKVLLEKSFCDNAVLWDVEMLPSSGKGSVNVDASRRNNQSNNNDSRDLLEDQLSLYVENCSDFYVDDDDVSSEFQIDSGTLPCVACGILGFPFMALVQPSKKAAKHFLPVELDSSSDHMGIIEDYDRVNGMERNGGRDDVSLSTQPRYSTVLGQTSESHHTDNASLELEKEWDVSKGFLRPRIFCLEHAIQTEQLLHAKGGANILVICHSDFQKMRAHATIVAEEIGTSLTYNEISLANASQGYLSLIDLAIEDEERDKCAEEDWTLKLNINLRHCVKVQRNCPLKKLKHALVLGGLFSDKTLASDSSSLKWQSTKVRTKRKSNDSTQFAVVRTDKVFVSSVDRQNAIRRNITIQYSRKRYKSKACSMNRDLNLASQGADFLVTSDEAQAVICTSSKSALEDKTDSNSIHTDHKDTAPESSGETEIGHVKSTTTSVENFQDNRDMTESGIGTKSAHLTEADRVGDHCGEAIMDRSLEPINSSGSCDQLIEDQVPEQSGSGSEASNSETLHKIQMDIADQDRAVSDHVVKEAPPSVERSVEVTEETSSPESGDENISEKHNEDTSRPTAKRVGRRSEVDLLANDECNVGGFIKSPCEGLRPRARKHIPGSRVEPVEAKVTGKGSSHSSLTRNDKKEERKGTHRCDLDGCTMSFKTKVELQLHKRNFCPIEGCGKQFTSHKYARIHQRVHEKDRPLKCPWKGCTMTFKWAWARIEHLRVHTGERPYKCKVEGCGLTFRFVSDYSRHRRKTGHYVDAAS